MSKQTYYVTTPIYYANAKPHLGTLYSSVIADVCARFERCAGKDVFFLTGTDEHGQKIYERAKELKLAPQALVDSMVPHFKEVWERFEIHYSRFIRTTEDEHKQVVQTIIADLIAQGDIYKATYTGWYCVPCETFVSSESNATNRCPACERELQEVSEENYFFRLSAYEDQLRDFYDAHPHFIQPKERAAEVTAFIRAGLKDISISRKGQPWGIPFPGDEEHTVYVWFDALMNYLTGVGYAAGVTGKQFVHYWPANVHVMAKDIVRFHAIYWPAFLMAAKLPLPCGLLVHGYVLAGDAKMSKSKGNTIHPLELAETYGVEQLRYYLVRKMAIAHDGQFSFDEFEACIASDLANNIGNLLSRMLKLAVANKLQELVPPSVWEPVSLTLHAQCADTFQEYWDDMTHGKMHTALGAVLRFASEVNAYFNEQKPWVLAKESPAFLAEVLSATAHALHAIALMLWPVMPKKMEALLQQIGMPFASGTDYHFILRQNRWQTSFVCTPLDVPLFPRPERKKKASEAEQMPVQEFAISIDDFAKSKLIVGTIMACNEVPKSSKLYALSVDFGPYGKRTILSGVRAQLTPAQLIGKQGVAVLNLPPRKMAGMVSEGMLLFAKDETGAFELATVSGPVANGTRLS